MTADGGAVSCVVSRIDGVAVFDVTRGPSQCLCKGEDGSVSGFWRNYLSTDSRGRGSSFNECGVSPVVTVCFTAHRLGRGRSEASSDKRALAKSEGQQAHEEGDAGVFDRLHLAGTPMGLLLSQLGGRC